MRTIVVGGGIIGLASAYYLAERGADVTVLEKGALGNASTGRSAGGIRKQFSTPVNVELSKISCRVWDRFEEEFGVDIARRQVGYLLLAREETTAGEFEANVAMQNDLGVPSEYLTPEEASEYCPELVTERFAGAAYLETDGFADPNLAVQGYANAATAAGVDVRTNVAVTDVHTRNERVTGVETGDGSIEAEYVVNATGAWLCRVAAMAGVDIPVVPRRRQLAVVEPEVPVPETVPLTIDLDTGSYFRPEREGAALVGGQFGDDPAVDPDAYRGSYDTEWAITALEHAQEYVSYFGPDSRIRNGWAGLYAVTPDHHPIVEEAIPGFVVAGGFSGHGFQHAPATGRLVAELVIDGSPSLVDGDRLASDRFETDHTPHERNVA